MRATWITYAVLVASLAADSATAAPHWLCVTVAMLAIVCALRFLVEAER